MKSRQGHTHCFERGSFFRIGLIVPILLGFCALSIRAQGTVGPGVPQVGSAARKSNASSSKAGSILFFHKYASDLSASDRINTSITLTNTNPQAGVTMRVFAIHDFWSDEKFVNLAPNQSRSLLASKEFPDTAGYIVAVAVGPTGAPIQFNWVIGSATVKDWDGYEGSYNAFSVARRAAGAVQESTGGYDLNFDGAQYDRLPQTIALDNFKSRKASLALYSPVSRLGTPPPYFDLSLDATIYAQGGRAATSELGGFALPYYDIAENLWYDQDLAGLVSSDSPAYASFTARDVSDPKKTKNAPVFGLAAAVASADRKDGIVGLPVLEWLQKYTVRMDKRVPTSPAAESPTTDQSEPLGGSTGASESKSGSVLFYPRWLAGTGGSSSVNLTNTHATQEARVRLLFSSLSPNTEVSEKILLIKPRQTVSINAADAATGQKGWVLALAINSGAQPIKFDYLIGSVHITDAAGGQTVFNAIAAAKNSDGPVERNADLKSANLTFDDAAFDRLPATVALASIPNLTGNAGFLSYIRIGSSMLDVPSARGAASLTVIDNATNSYSVMLGPAEYKLNDLRLLRFSPALGATALDPGSAWLKFPMSTPLLAVGTNTPLSGIFQTSNDIWSGGFMGSTNFHTLTSVDKYVVTVPAGNPGNQPPYADFAPLDSLIEARSAEGTIVRLDGSASTDPDEGDTLTYQWFDKDVLISTAAISDYRLSRGSHEIKLIVTDSSGEASDPYSQPVVVSDTTPPVISRLPFTLNLVISDTTVPLIYSMPIAYDSIDGIVNVKSNRPSGSTLGVGTYSILFTAVDKSGNKSSAIWEVTVTQGEGSSSGGGTAGATPFLANLADQYLKPGEVRKIVLQADDADGDPVSFRVNGPLNYMTLGNPDPAARRVTLFIGPLPPTFTPTQYRISVSDNKGQSYLTLPFLVGLSSVSNLDPGNGGSGGGRSNRAPTAVMAPLPASIDANEADGIVIKLDGSNSTDEDLDSLTYSWTDGGVAIAQGAVVFVKLGVGSHSIVLTVSDGRGGVTSSAASIQVLPRPLSITGFNPQRLIRGTDNYVVVTGTGFVPGTKVYLGNDIIVSAPLSLSENAFAVWVTVLSFANTGSRDAIVISPGGKTASLRAGVLVQ